MLVYTTVLYAYGFGIMAARQLPKGLVGWMVSAYALIGVGVWLVNYLPQLHQTALSRFFHRWFFRLLLPLLLLLAAAIWQRIAQYGVTEERYFLALLNVWLFFLACYYLLARAAALRVIAASAFILTVASSFGPWSAFSVSKHSQLRRWSGYLSQLNVTAPAFDPAQAGADTKVQQELSRICDYLAKVHGQETFRQYFAGNRNIIAAIEKSNAAGSGESPETRGRERFCPALLSALGLRYLQPYESTENIVLRTREHYADKQYAVRGYDYVLVGVQSSPARQIPGSGISLEDKTGTLIISESGKAIAEINYSQELLAAVAKITEANMTLTEVPEEALTFEMQALPRVKAKFLFRYVTLSGGKEHPVFSYLTYDLLLRIEAAGSD